MLFSASCLCFGQTSTDQSRSSSSFSDSIEFSSQIGAHFSTDKKRKVEGYSFPQLKVGEEVETGPITLSVSVLDANARPVSDLTARDFSMNVEGLECRLTTVEKVINPAHVIFLLDRSVSSGDLLKVMRDNAKALMRDLAPDSIVSVATFSSSLKFKIQKTRDKVLAAKELDDIRDFEDGTSLYDALRKLAKDPALNGNGTVIVLLTDGIDTTSRDSIAESFAAVERARSTIYPVYLDSYTAYLKSRPATGRKPGSTVVPGFGRVLLGPPEPSQEESEIGRMYLNDVASLSAGRPVAASYLNDSAPFNLGNELSSRHQVTCSPSAKYRLNQRLRVKVRVARSGLVVLARSNFVVSK